MLTTPSCRPITTAFLVLVLVNPLLGGDWPMRRYDAREGHATLQALVHERLGQRPEEAVGLAKWKTEDSNTSSVLTSGRRRSVLIRHLNPEPCTNASSGLPRARRRSIFRPSLHDIRRFAGDGSCAAHASRSSPCACCYRQPRRPRRVFPTPAPTRTALRLGPSPPMRTSVSTASSTRRCGGVPQ